MKIRLGIYVNIQNFKSSSLYHTFMLGTVTPRRVARTSEYHVRKSATRPKRMCVPVNHPSVCLNVCRASWKRLIIVSVLSRWGYSLYVGSYICATVLTPFFYLRRIEHNVLGVLFLIHQHQNDLFGYQAFQNLFGPKFNFCLDLLESNFQRPMAQPHWFSDRVPPRVNTVW